MDKNKEIFGSNQLKLNGEPLCEYLKGELCYIFIKNPELINYDKNRLRMCTMRDLKEIGPCARLKKLSNCLISAIKRNLKNEH